MLIWHQVRREARAVAEVVRFHQTPGADDPQPLRAQRLAAAVVGLMVLAGATVTYLSVVGRFEPPAGHDPVPSSTAIQPVMIPLTTSPTTGPSAVS